MMIYNKLPTPLNNFIDCNQPWARLPCLNILENMLFCFGFAMLFCFGFALDNFVFQYSIHNMVLLLKNCIPSAFVVWNHGMVSMNSLPFGQRIKQNNPYRKKRVAKIKESCQWTIYKQFLHPCSQIGAL